MSNSCVITNEKTGQKIGYGCDCNRMNFAIENPELTYTVDAYQTACGAVDIDFEHPEVSINKAIDLQENYYKSIGMPTSLSELGVKESDLEKLALNCSRNKQRVLNGYKKLGYDEMFAIFKMAL